MLQLLLFYVFCPLHNETIVTYTTSHTRTHINCATFLTRGPGGAPLQDHARHDYGRVTASFDKPPSRVVPQASQKGGSRCRTVRARATCVLKIKLKKKKRRNKQPACNEHSSTVINLMFVFYYFFVKQNILYLYL